MSFKFSDILHEARNDPKLKNTLDIDKLLACTNGDSKHDAMDEIFTVLESIHLPKGQLQEYCRKLVKYCWVEELHEIKIGKYIRWIRRDHPEKLTMGGILTDVRFTEKGTYLFVHILNSKISVKFHFDQYLVFQKQRR